MVNLYDKLQYPISSETNKGLRNAQIGAIHVIASYATLDKTGSSIIVMPTGTEKTAAFPVPILQAFSKEAFNTKGKRQMKTLILAPTRELAIQINDSFKAYGRKLGLKSLVT